MTKGMGGGGWVVCTRPIGKPSSGKSRKDDISYSRTSTTAEGLQRWNYPRIMGSLSVM